MRFSEHDLERLARLLGVVVALLIFGVSSGCAAVERIAETVLLPTVRQLVAAADEAPEKLEDLLAETRAKIQAVPDNVERLRLQQEADHREQLAYLRAIYDDTQWLIGDENATAEESGVSE